MAYEFKTVTGVLAAAALDLYLNDMEQKGWEIFKLEFFPISHEHFDYTPPTQNNNYTSKSVVTAVSSQNFVVYNNPSQTDYLNWVIVHRRDKTANLGTKATKRYDF